MSHNATGYNEDINPRMMDGLSDPRGTSGPRNNAKLALRCEAIVHRLDPARIVYHHSSGNLSAMYTLNFYPNFVPIQELDDWFEHWSTAGVKPLVLVSTARRLAGIGPCIAAGTMAGASSAAPPCRGSIASPNGTPSFSAMRPTRSATGKKPTCAGRREQFRAGRAWHRWDYPYPVGDARLDELQPVQAAYTTDNWRAFRTWGLSGNSPWEFDRFWKLRDGFQPRRQELPVDWEQPAAAGLSARISLTTPTRALIWLTSAPTGFPRPPPSRCSAITMPLLGWIAGKPEHFTTKDHDFLSRRNHREATHRD